MDRFELIETIKSRGAVIFGTGFAAGMFMQILKERKLDGRVRYFLETAKSKEIFYDLPVYSLDEAPLEQGGEPPLICAAVHDAIAGQIMPVLEKRYGGRAVWVYPMLSRLAFGDPIYTGDISVRDVIAAQPAENRWITVRYAALCGYRAAKDQGEAVTAYLKASAGDIDIGRRIYIKTQSRFSRPRTAEERLKRLWRISDDIASRGWKADPVLLDTDMRVIDGLHRLALAVYFGIGSISCELAKPSALYDSLFTGKNRITPAAQTDAGLTEIEIVFLDSMRSCLAMRAEEGRKEHEKR